MELALNYDLLGEKPCLSYFLEAPPPVKENEDHIVHWDKPILTDIVIIHNNTGVILIEMKMKKAADPSDS